MAEFLTFGAQELLTKVATLAAQEFTLLWGFKADIANLRDSLLFLEAVLRDAEHKQQHHGEAAKLWLAKLEDIAHLADDLLDDYGYELLRRKVELRNQMKRKVLDFFSRSNPVVFRLKMAHRIKIINSSLEDLSKRATGFGFVERPPLEATSSYGRRLDRETYSDFKIDENIIIGREALVKDVVKDLTELNNNNKENNLSVLAIVGMGGLGKTTFAKSVFHDGKIEQHFQQKIWVCVSIPFEVNVILRGVLESLKPEQAGVQTREAICRILKTELAEKKYLLVLDDVWNEDAQKWEEMMGCLLNITGTRGSCIIVTTRSDKVGKMVETLPRCDLGKLSDDDCWLILKNKAIPVGSIVSITEDQVRIGKEIAKKCRGVPLVAKVLGSMMHYKNLDDWQSIVESGIWDLPDEENRILAVLKLSFDELRSPALKQCFAYCSLFVKDHVFEKEDLIQLWMAQGWLHPSPNQNDLEMEDTGNEYFEILFQNSFFQDRRSLYSRMSRYGNYYPTGTTCNMHDLVHDLAERVSKSKYLRSLFSNGGVLDYKSPGYQALRVLNLRKADIQELPNSLGKLKYLRYLNVTETKIKAFPKSLGQLYNLQTLKMPNHLEEFPKEIVNMINLRHIYFGENVKVPPGILGRLTNLRSLPPINLLEQTGPQIGEFGGLNQLRDVLSISNLQHVRTKDEAERARLVEKKNISRLILTWMHDRPSNSADSDEVVLEALQPHSSLEVLEICNFMGFKVPSWLSLCYKLKKIELNGCSNCEGVPLLGRLPNLVHVKMRGMQSLRCLGHEFYGFDNKSGDRNVLFPSLEKLHIEARNLVDWMEVPKERAKVFPCLKKLTLIACVELRSAPSHFPSLERLRISNMNRGGTPVTSILSTSLNTLTSLELCNVNGLACLPESLLENNLNLSRMVIRSCEDLTGIAPPLSRCCSSLLYLTIWQCPKLSCLPDWLLPSLQELNIRECPQLSSLPDWLLPSLQELNICGCPQLSSLPDWLLPSLQVLNIRECPQLSSLPDWLLPSLQELNIRECPQLSSLPDWLLPSLQELNISGCPQLSSLPDWLQYCTSLREMYLTTCPKIMSIPIPAEGLPSLVRLYIGQCSELSIIPNGLDCCVSLVDLSITACPKVTSFPLDTLSKTLRNLCVSNVEYLPTLNGGFTSLLELIIEESQFTHIDLPMLVSLQKLQIRNCHNLETVRSLDKLISLSEFSIRDCSSFTSLPGGLPHNLKSLFIDSFWKELELQVLPSLKFLHIDGRSKIKSLPGEIQHLTSLTRLNISSIRGLEAIPDWLGNLASLACLDINSCMNLMYLPSIQAMKRLTKLNILLIRRCPLMIERCREESGPEWPKISHITDATVVFLRKNSSWEYPKLRIINEHLYKHVSISNAVYEEFRKIGNKWFDVTSIKNSRGTPIVTAIFKAIKTKAKAPMEVLAILMAISFSVVVKFPDSINAY